MVVGGYYWSDSREVISDFWTETPNEWRECTVEKRGGKMCVLNRGNEKWKGSEETVESVPCISWKRKAFSQRNDSLTVEFQARRSDVGQSFFFFFFFFFLKPTLWRYEEWVWSNQEPVIRPEWLKERKERSKMLAETNHDGNGIFF